MKAAVEHHFVKIWQNSTQKWSNVIGLFCDQYWWRECCTVDHDDNRRHMMEVKIYLLMFPLTENVKFMLFFLLLLLWIALFIFHSRANAHEPVELGNPSCIHLPYENTCNSELMFKMCFKVLKNMNFLYKLYIFGCQKKFLFFKVGRSVFAGLLHAY